jgi:serine/threonine protein phosphatase PrpC
VLQFTSNTCLLSCTDKLCYFLQPKWNDALLEVFRIDYVGSSPYITCNPSLFHHRLSTRDRFLILSSDGLYQYFTNEEAVAQVETFIATTPEGDPAQHLVEEVLFRAANKAGMLKSNRVFSDIAVQLLNF